MRSKLQIVVAACALAVLGSGCSGLWRVPFSRTESIPAKPSIASASDAAIDSIRAGSPSRPAGATNSQSSPGATASDLAGVLDKLQQVRELDPAAEQKLLEELRQTPSESWPLVAEQFRASLAYHKTLTESGPVARRQAVTAVGGSVDSLSESPQPAAIERPSAPIGALVDPRSTSSDGVSSEALARATPYSMPAPSAAAIAGAPPYASAVPADFASDGPIYPMAAREPSSAQAASALSANAHQQWPATHQVTPAIAETSVASPERLADMEAPPAASAVDKADWHQLVGRAADDLGARVAKSPSTTAEVHQHVSLRILRLLAGDTERALEPIPHISPTEHDYWSRQLFALATYLDHHSQPDDKRRAAASVTHLDEAVARLRELGSLSVRNLAFCKNVYGYGAIEPYDAERFSPGEQVSLYFEVENYHSKSTEKGYCTALGSTYEILDDQGERVGGGAIPDVNDCCRSRRRDFHIQYGLALPEKLPPGQYRLQLVIKDRQSDKMGNATAPFEIKGSAL